METSQFRFNFDAVPWQSPLAGCRFKVVVRGNKQARLLEFKREFIEPHWCEKGHTGVILKGDLEIDFRGRIESYPKGSGLFIPAGLEGAHKARALTDHALLFLVEDV